MAKEIDYGKCLEKKLLDEARLQRHTLIKVPEKFVGGYSARGVRQLPTPFDYCGSVDKTAIFFDAKACGKTSFDLGTYVFADKKVHQYKSLLEVHSNGDIAGYIIWLYHHGRIGFISVDRVQQLYRAEVKSINLETIGYFHQPDSQPFNFRNLLIQS